MSKRAKIIGIALLGILIASAILFRSLKILNIVAGVECIVYGIVMYCNPRLVGVELKNPAMSLISFIIIGILNFYSAYLNR